MEIEESVLQLEVNKLRRTAAGKGRQGSESAEQKPPGDTYLQEQLQELPPAEEKESFSLDAKERELLRIILVHGNVMIRVEAEDEKSENHDIEITLAEFIIF